MHFWLSPHVDPCQNQHIFQSIQPRGCCTRTGLPDLQFRFQTQLHVSPPALKFFEVPDLCQARPMNCKVRQQETIVSTIWTHFRFQWAPTSQATRSWRRVGLQRQFGPNVAYAFTPNDEPRISEPPIVHFLVWAETCILKR